MTVQDVLNELKKSNGFVMFVSYGVRNEETGEVTIEHRFLRQQYVPEDLDKSFDAFKGMVAKDLSESGQMLIRSAEKIAAASFPIEDANYKST